MTSRGGRGRHGHITRGAAAPHAPGPSHMRRTLESASPWQVVRAYAYLLGHDATKGVSPRVWSRFVGHLWREGQTRGAWHLARWLPTTVAAQVARILWGQAVDLPAHGHGCWLRHHMCALARIAQLTALVGELLDQFQEEKNGHGGRRRRTGWIRPDVWDRWHCVVAGDDADGVTPPDHGMETAGSGKPEASPTQAPAGSGALGEGNTVPVGRTPPGGDDAASSCPPAGPQQCDAAPSSGAAPNPNPH